MLNIRILRLMSKRDLIKLVKRWMGKLEQFPLVLGIC